MNAKINEGKLISGKDALIALASGDEVEWTHFSVGEWHKVPQKTAKLQYFLDDDLGWKFRLKPRTITINGIEVPAPFSRKRVKYTGVLAHKQSLGMLTMSMSPSVPIDVL